MDRGSVGTLFGGPEPGAYLGMNGGIMEQVDVVSPPEDPHVRGLDTAMAAPAGTAGNADDEVAEKKADGMGRLARDHAGDEVLLDTGRQRDVTDDVAQQGVGLHPLPIDLTGCAETKIFDPNAAEIEELTERAALRGEA